MNILERGSFKVSHLTSIQAEQNALMDSVCEQAKDWKSIASMVLGGGVYKLSKYALLNKLPFLGEALASGLALGFEVSGYRAASQVLEGKGLSARGVFEKEAWLRDYINFGTLKSLSRVTQGSNFVLNNFVPSLGMLAGHHLAYGLHLAAKPEGTLAQQFAHAFITDLQMRASLALFHTMTGNFILNQEALLDLGMKLQDKLELPMLQKNFLGDSRNRVLVWSAMRNVEKTKWVRRGLDKDREYRAIDKATEVFRRGDENIWVDVFLLQEVSISKAINSSLVEMFTSLVFGLLDGKIKNALTINGEPLKPVLRCSGLENYFASKGRTLSDISYMEIAITAQGEVLDIGIYDSQQRAMFQDELRVPGLTYEILDNQQLVVPPYPLLSYPLPSIVHNDGTQDAVDSTPTLHADYLPDGCPAPVDDKASVPVEEQATSTYEISIQPVITQYPAPWTHWHHYVQLGKTKVWRMNLPEVNVPVRVAMQIFEEKGVDIDAMNPYFLQNFREETSDKIFELLAGVAQGQIPGIRFKGAVFDDILKGNLLKILKKHQDKSLTILMGVDLNLRLLSLVCQAAEDVVYAREDIEF